MYLHTPSRYLGLREAAIYKVMSSDLTGLRAVGSLASPTLAVFDPAANGTKLWPVGHLQLNVTMLLLCDH